VEALRDENSLAKEASHQLQEGSKILILDGMLAFLHIVAKQS
jgi:hypothetical protein